MFFAALVWMLFTVSISDNLMVTGAHKIGVNADILFRNADYKQAEMIVFAGRNARGKEFE